MRLFLLIFVSFLSLNCATRRYFAPSGNVPLMREKGDFRATGAASTSGIDLHAAYAFHQHLAVAASASLPGAPNTEDTSTELYGSLGAFMPLGNGGSLELYGGGGGGRYGMYDMRGEIIRAFSQLNIGYSSQFIDTAFITRVAYMNLERGSGYPSSQVTTLEPGVLLRLGFRHIKAESQLMIPFPLHEQRSLYVMPVVFTLGLSTQLNFGGDVNSGSNSRLY